MMEPITNHAAFLQSLIADNDRIIMQYEREILKLKGLQHDVMLRNANLRDELKEATPKPTNQNQ